eukprot:g10188.t1
MTRHAKNRTDLPYQTYTERKESGYSKFQTEKLMTGPAGKWPTAGPTIKLGTDVQLPFGFCCLSLKPAIDPVASPYGHVFDREFILNSLMTQKQENNKLKLEFEKQRARDNLEQQHAEASAKRRKIQAFEQQELGNSMGGQAGGGAAGHNFTSSRDEFTAVDKKSSRKENFWVASDAPMSKQKRLTEKDVKKHTECPITGKKLKLKDLIPVKFEICNEEMVRSGGGRGMYCCAVTKKPITHQKCLLLRPSGVVLLDEAAVALGMEIPERERLDGDGGGEAGNVKLSGNTAAAISISASSSSSAKSKSAAGAGGKKAAAAMVCPVTNAKLEKADVIALMPGNTGFSAHNDIEAKAFKFCRSSAQMNADRCGSLGAKGMVR